MGAAHHQSQPPVEQVQELGAGVFVRTRLRAGVLEAHAIRTHAALGGGEVEAFEFPGHLAAAEPLGKVLALAARTTPSVRRGAAAAKK